MIPGPDLYVCMYVYVPKANITPTFFAAQLYSSIEWWNFTKYIHGLLMEN
jgi:hypothetical protein